jgi:archaellum biogenesis ATPase FlaH
LSRLLPEGLPIPSSTIISGPGRSGKPLIGLAIVASWLLQGKKVILIPLQYPDRGFTEKDLKRLYSIELGDYEGSFFFVKFDLDLPSSAEAVEQIGPDEVKANLVSPEAWSQALYVAKEALGPSPQSILIYGSALNLLLFSPTYGDIMLSTLQHLLKNDKKSSYLFTVSTTVLKEKIRVLEQAADHLFYTSSDRPEMKLKLRVARLTGTSFAKNTIEVPFTPDVLQEIKEMADKSRVTLIRQIREI